LNDPILTIFLERYLVSLVVSGSSSGDFDVRFPYANNFWFECLSETAMNKKDKANPSWFWKTEMTKTETTSDGHWVFFLRMFS